MTTVKFVAEESMTMRRDGLVTILKDVTVYSISQIRELRVNLLVPGSFPAVVEREV